MVSLQYGAKGGDIPLTAEQSVGWNREGSYAVFLERCNHAGILFMAVDSGQTWVPAAHERVAPDVKTRGNSVSFRQPPRQ
jgi:hypothetical protein